MAVAFTNMINLRREKLQNISSDELSFLASEYEKNRSLLKQYLSRHFKELYKDTSFHTQTVDILQYDLCGNFIKEWKGIKHVARTLGMSQQEITGCIRGRHSYAKGYIWRLKTENYPMKIEPLKVVNGMSKGTVLQYSLLGDFIREWESLSIASKALGLRKIKMSHDHAKRISSGGFMWLWKNGEIR